jgi:hypothetical protein
MSLINEALKKAQKQRTGEAPTLSAMPSIGGERPVNIARRGKPAGPGGLLLPIGLGFGALVIVIVGGIFLFRGKSTDSAPTATPAAPQVATAPAPVVSAPAVSTPAVSAPPVAAPATTSVSTFVVPNVSTSSAPAKPEPVVAESEPVRPTPAPVTTQVAAAPAPTLVVTTPAPEPARPAVPPPQLEPRAINHIESLRVAGIRASATDPKDSKVLMNDRVYRIGNIVEAEMGLRLVEITSSSLTFEDARGGRYTRTF